VGGLGGAGRRTRGLALALGVPTPAPPTLNCPTSCCPTTGRAPSWASPSAAPSGPSTPSSPATCRP